MRLLVTGDRNWSDQELISHWIGQLQPEVVIEGEARGADQMARYAAEFYGIRVMKFPADWWAHGKSAGPRRNRQMLREGAPTRVLAFHDNIAASKGTKDMIDAALKAGLHVTLVSHAEVIELEPDTGFGLT